MFGKIRKPVAAALVAGAFLVGGGAAAHATISYVGGGTWDHGVNSSIVWSDYYHGSKCHGSTSVGSYTERDNAPAGWWSVTSAPSRVFVVDKAYYRTSCS